MSRTCPLCTEQNLELVLRSIYTGCGVVNYPFSLMKCPSCELHAVDPMPSNDVYPVSRDASGEFIQSDLEATYEWNIPLLKNVQKYVKQGELLDLGCNAGDFVSIAEKHGYRSLGVEIDGAAATAGKKMGRNVVQGDFLKMNFDKKFDAIVMNHTLEHIPNFAEVPGALNRLVKGDGAVIINVPYYQSWLGQLLKQKWSQMAPFTHAWFYSKQSIETLFSPWFNSIEMFTNSSCEPHTIRTFNIKPLIKGLVIRTFRTVGHGDELRVILRRPKAQL